MLLNRPFVTLVAGEMDAPPARADGGAGFLISRSGVVHRGF